MWVRRNFIVLYNYIFPLLYEYLHLTRYNVFPHEVDTKVLSSVVNMAVILPVLEPGMP